ncbi:hypothetical protein CU098_011552, partial [Rhizopus stolonifer]
LVILLPLQMSRCTRNLELTDKISNPVRPLYQYQRWTVIAYGDAPLQATYRDRTPVLNKVC